MESEKQQIEELLLKEVDEKSKANSSVFAEAHKFNHDAVVGVIKSLEAAGMLKSESSQSKFWVLTDEASEYAEKGTPEARVWALIPEGGIKKEELGKLAGAFFNIGFAKAMASKWIAFDKASGIVRKQGAAINDECKHQLATLKEKHGHIDALPDKALNDLKKRKLISQGALTTFTVVKGEKFSRQRAKQATDITAEMLQSGEWKNLDFKPYNFKALGSNLSAGALHPLLKVRTEFRRILMEMGFSEMPTNNYVESSFWNFDALFQPQQHPARDSHDTFFVDSPAVTLNLPEDYVQRVKQMHETGGSDSIGWRYDWKLGEAQKNLLRTHTTAVSSRVLSELAKQPFKPVRYFSIDRVFRNEAVDATHLAEFFQIEGFIMDRNLTLGHLIGVISTFFSKIGISNVKFKPAYNPYTEPSMEIFGYSHELGKEIEIGNSGMFRPEMLRPMGFPEDVRVIAWGLSLERPTMIKYGIKNIRDLSGHKVDLAMVKSNPIPRYP